MCWLYERKVRSSFWFFYFLLSELAFFDFDFLLVRSVTDVFSFLSISDFILKRNKLCAEGQLFDVFESGIEVDTKELSVWLDPFIYLIKCCLDVTIFNFVDIKTIVNFVGLFSVVFKQEILHEYY